MSGFVRFPPKPVDADLARWVQRILQLDIERAGTKAAAVHRTQHLDVAYRVKPEAFRDPFLDDRQEGCSFGPSTLTETTW